MKGAVCPAADSTVLVKKQAVNQQLLHKYMDEAERRLFQAEREGEKSDGWSRARCKTSRERDSAGRAGRVAYVRPLGWDPEGSGEPPKGSEPGDKLVQVALSIPKCLDFVPELGLKLASV